MENNNKPDELAVDFSNVANKFFSKHPDIRDKFLENLVRFYLKKQKNIDIEKIQGVSIPQYRMRIGKYRVIFTKKGKILHTYYIFVDKADSRGDIY